VSFHISTGAKREEWLGDDLEAVSKLFLFEVARLSHGVLIVKNS